VPLALAGSIALALTATPALAADNRSAERMPGARTSSLERLGGSLSGLRADKAVPHTYTVTLGDTVSSIAARFGLRTTDVLALNHLGWNSIIQPGQVLRLTAAPAASRAPAAPRAASVVYTIKPGDSVSSIAHHHGVSVKALLAANRLSWSSVIYVGHKLVIPGKAGSSSSTSRQVHATGGKYTVKPGDTVSAIAHRFGVPVQSMLEANRLGWASIIYPGEKLRIPEIVTIAGFDHEQLANAKLIVRIGRQLGVPDRGIAIALGTAMQESGLYNLSWGDRDSLGLFQQRPSAGWGTPAQISDPDRATRAFYGGPKDPNGSDTRGLLDIPGWQHMTFTQAAQAVQISAFPDAYAQWEKYAVAWLAALT
jgi:LysM repeat protein